MHADGHRFGKTKWRVVAKGRMKGQRERRRKKEKEKEKGARIAIHTKSILFVPRRPPRHYHHRASPLCLSSKLCSQFTSDQVSALRFYANPMPMSCRRRGEPLPLRRVRTEGDFIFRGPRAIPFSAGLFQGNHFPSLFGLRPSTRLWILYFFTPFSSLSACIRFSLSSLSRSCLS